MRERTVKRCANGCASPFLRSVPNGFPSRATCVTCHRVADAQVLGARSDQWNRIVQYADGPNHQLTAVSAIGMFAALDPASLPRMPALSDVEFRR